MVFMWKSFAPIHAQFPSLTAMPFPFPSTKSKNQHLKPETSYRCCAKAEPPIFLPCLGGSWTTPLETYSFELNCIISTSFGVNKKSKNLWKHTLERLFLNPTMSWIFKWTIVHPTPNHQVMWWRFPTWNHPRLGSTILAVCPDKKHPHSFHSTKPYPPLKLTKSPKIGLLPNKRKPPFPLPSIFFKGELRVLGNVTYTGSRWPPLSHLKDGGETPFDDVF